MKLSDSIVQKCLNKMDPIDLEEIYRGVYVKAHHIVSKACPNLDEKERQNVAVRLKTLIQDYGIYRGGGPGGWSAQKRHDHFADRLREMRNPRDQIVEGSNGSGISFKEFEKATRGNLDKLIEYTDDPYELNYLDEFKALIEGLKRQIDFQTIEIANLNVDKHNLKMKIERIQIQKEIQENKRRAK